MGRDLGNSNENKEEWKKWAAWGGVWGGVGICFVGLGGFVGCFLALTVGLHAVPTNGGMDR